MKNSLIIKLFLSRQYFSPFEIDLTDNLPIYNIYSVIYIQTQTFHLR